MMDLQKIPPIHQKRIVTFVNYFIIDTVSFLNNFINASENTLWKLEKRMRKLDTTLKLLESKLNFIPDTAETESPVNNPSISSDDKNVTSTNELKENEEESTEGKGIVGEENEEKITKPSEEIPEEVQKYVKMVKVGVPIEAVKLKMKNDNVDPNLLKLE